MVSAPLQQELLHTLGLAIAAGALPANQVLTLEHLCERYGVSRSVARAAVGSLETLGMVAARRRVGVIVRPLSEWDVLNPRIIDWRLNGPGRDRQLQSLTALRLGVEPIAASAAAGHIDGEAAHQLQQLAEQMRRHGEAGRRTEFIELDARFHELILTHSGNELYAALSAPVLAAINGRSKVGLMPDHPVASAINLHAEVADAIAARDGAAAEQAMRSILSEVHEAVSTVAD